MRKPSSYIKVFVVMAAMLALALATVPAQAATTPDDIYKMTMKGFNEGKNFNELVSEAFATAKAEGIPYYQIMAGLARGLWWSWESGGARTRWRPYDEVSAAIINKVCEYGLNRAETMRAVSQMILGMRAASLRHGLDQEVVKGRVNAALNGAACSLQFAEAVIDPSFQEAVLATYTAAGHVLRDPGPSGRAERSIPTTRAWTTPSSRWACRTTTSIRATRLAASLASFQNTVAFLKLVSVS